MSKTLNQADRDATETLKRVYRLISKGLAMSDDMAALDAAETWLARGQTFGPSSHVKHIDPDTGQIKAVTFINMITGKIVGKVNAPFSDRPSGRLAVRVSEDYPAGEIRRY